MNAWWAPRRANLVCLKHEVVAALPCWSEFHKTDSLADCTDFNSG